MQNTQRPAGRWFRLLILPVVLLPVAGGVFPRSTEAALIQGSYQINWDQNVDKTKDGTTNSEIFKQVAELKYKGMYSPVVTNEVTLKVEHEINSDQPTLIRLLPTIDLGFRGIYWEGKVGVKRTFETKDEPGTPPRTSDSYFAEFFYTAPKRVPDFKGKYSVDTDFQEKLADTVKKALTLSSVYSPNGWLTMKGEYSKNLGEDRVTVDSDTEEEKFSGILGLRRIVNKKIRLSTEYKVEQTRGATLLTRGGTKDRVETQNHSWRNTGSFRPFRDTTFDGGFDLTLSQNMVTGEHTLVDTSRVSLSQKIGDPIDFKGEYSHIVTQNRHTQAGDDYQTAEDSWNLDMKAKFSKVLDFTMKYQNKDTVETHQVVKSSEKQTGTEVSGVTWQAEFGDWLRPAASFERTNTLDNNVRSKVETKYSLKSTFDFRAINLTLDPAYDITLGSTFVPAPKKMEETRDFRVKVAYLVFRTRTLEGKLDHTYGRIAKGTFDPTDATEPEKRSINRTDSTQAGVVWLAPLPGWKLSFDATRQASDTSGDDLPPDITSSFGGKADVNYPPMTLGTSYKYDRKKIGDNSEIFDAKGGWVAPKWDVTLSYTFKKTFSETLKEGYSISLTFKYNL